MSRWTRYDVVYSTRRAGWVWMRKGAVYRATKADDRWDSTEHPRDARGRFVEKYAFVRLFGGGTGTIVGYDSRTRRFEVQRDFDGRVVMVLPAHITIAPRPADRPHDTPPARPPDAPPFDAPVPAPAADEPRARPGLSRPDRQTIRGLRLENDPDMTPEARETARKLRASEDMSAADMRTLAEALRLYGTDPDVSPSRRRGLERMANRLETTALQLDETEPGVEPGLRVEKVNPADLGIDDVIALPRPGGGTEMRKIRDFGTLWGGTLPVELESADGTRERYLLPVSVPVFRVSNVPDDVPLPPPEGPVREHVHPDRIMPGDTIEIPVGGGQVRVREIAAINRESAVSWNVDLRDPETGEIGEGFGFSSEDGLPTMVRIGRGPDSQDQAWDGRMPAEKPEMIRFGEMRVGDRVDIDLLGTIIGIERDDSRVALTIRRDNGRVQTVYPHPDLFGRRLVAADANAAERIARQIEQSRRNVARDRIARWLNDLEDEAYRFAARTGGADRDFAQTRVAAAAAISRLGAGIMDPRALTQFTTRTDQSLARLVDELAPDADADERQAIQDRLRPLLGEIVGRARSTVREAVRAAAPVGGENEADAVRRVLRQYRDTPPTPDYTRVADVLSGLRGRLADTPAENKVIPVRELPELPEGMSFADRVAAYRAAIDGGPENFGKVRVRRTMPKPLALAELEAGKVPEVETVDTFVLDRAADGGPGETALHHLAVLRAAGADLNREINRLVDQAPAAQQNEYDRLRIAALRANEEHERLVEKRWNELVKTREILARREGFDSWDALNKATNQAESEHGKTSAAYLKLKALRSKVYALAESSTPTKEIDRAQQEVNLLHDQAEKARRDDYAGNLRSAAQSVLSEARGEPMGEMPLNYSKTPGPSSDYHTSVALRELPGLRRAMALAEESYPRSWLARYRDSGRTISLTTVRRGFYRDSTPTPVIALSKGRKRLNDPRDNGYGRVAVHELGHGMEYVTPGLAEAQNVFLWDRTTVSGPIGAREREAQVKIYNTAQEQGYKDKFSNHYSGKYYDGDNFELFTTGMESLMAGSEYLDEDFRNWLVGSLALL
jgi:hypothetical protein